MNKALKNCIICEASKVELLYQPLKIVKCLNCGLVYRDVFGIEEGYYFNLDKYRLSLQDSVKMAARKRDARLRFDILGNIIDVRGRLFDIGANDGVLMAEAKKRGLEVFGCEPNNFAAQYAKDQGLNIISGPFEDIFSQVKREKPFDIITMFHVLEHFAEPLKILNMVKEILSTEGYLVIEVPDIKSPISKIYQWEHLRIHKEHLYYFNKKTLSLLLQKAGFEVVFLKRKVWDGLNRPFIENLIRLPIVSELYAILRKFKKNLKAVFGIQPISRTTLEDNTELWIKGEMKEGNRLFSYFLGRLIFNLDRGDDLLVVCKVYKK